MLCHSKPAAGKQRNAIPDIRIVELPWVESLKEPIEKIKEIFPSILVSVSIPMAEGMEEKDVSVANSGVDIGDVDVTSIAAGSNLVGDMGISGAILYV